MRVAAIVPAYDEAERIGVVLEALKQAKTIDEVIVIDDASTDGTSRVARSAGVRLLKNRRNRGKAQSMERGVQSTDAEVIFFCDADLRGLTPEIVDAIVKPVLEGKCAMSIGIRNNITQKTVPLIALNSGERALKREVWEALPGFYKHRFRVEVGLNYLVWVRFGRINYKRHRYYQTFKETKYGFWRGHLYRWWMNFDVVVAWLRMQLYDKFLLRADE